MLLRRLPKKSSELLGLPTKCPRTRAERPPPARACPARSLPEPPSRMSAFVRDVESQPAGTFASRCPALPRHPQPRRSVGPARAGHPPHDAHARAGYLFLTYPVRICARRPQNAPDRLDHTGGIERVSHARTLQFNLATCCIERHWDEWNPIARDIGLDDVSERAAAATCRGRRRDGHRP